MILTFSMMTMMIFVMEMADCHGFLDFSVSSGGWVGGGEEERGGGGVNKKVESSLPNCNARYLGVHQDEDTEMKESGSITESSNLHRTRIHEDPELSIISVSVTFIRIIVCINFH